MTETHRIWTEITRLADEFLKAKDQLKFGIEQAEEEGVQLRHLLAGGGGWLDDNSLEHAIEVGRFNHEQRNRNTGEHDEWLDAMIEREADEVGTIRDQPSPEQNG